jgi:RNA polymerase sigma-70 factor (ECF subfamily)
LGFVEPKRQPDFKSRCRSLFVIGAKNCKKKKKVCNEMACKESYIRKRGENVTEFEEVYQQYFKDVFQYSLALCKDETLAEELTQQTFFKALEGIDGFNGTCKIRVWLCQIAKNTYFSMLKKEKRDEANCQAEEPVDDTLEQKLVNRDTAFQIHKQLHHLEEPYKEVFTLRLFGELSFAQIAELFEKTESWARVTYHRAAIKLKENM